MPLENQDRIPLILGITGHRNLHPDELELLSQRIRDIIQQLRDNYPNTPLLLLSPLAEGADRLAAQVALQEKLEVIVPFPLPKEEYCRDFKTPESLNEFNQLLEECHHSFTLPTLGPGIEQKKSPARFAQYTLVGAYVARHSHLLIALWDGRKQPNPGSTHEVIQFRLTGNMQELPEAYKPPRNPLDFTDTGKVCHIKVSRDNDPKFIDAGEIHILSPGQTATNNLSSLLSEEFRQIDEFNRDVADYSQHGDISFQRGVVLPSVILERLSEPFKKMSRIHEIASFLSVNNHRPTENAIRAIFILGVLMVLAIEFYSYLPWLPNGTNPNWILGVYISLFALAYTIFQWINRHNTHFKYIHYRALAEALRVQMFWQLGGLSESAADFYQRKHRSELEWVGSSVRALCTHNWVNDQQGIEVVRDYWIKKQIKYFKRRTQGNYQRLAWIQGMAKGLFITGLSLAAFLFGWAWLNPDSVQEQQSLHNYLIILMVFLPAIGAALDAYAEKAGFDAHFRRYQAMAVIFQLANDTLQDADEKTQLGVLLELGKAVLEENSDWVLLHRERPVKLLKG